MPNHSISDGLAGKIISVFRTGDRKNDHASERAMINFIKRIEDGTTTQSQAHKYLSDKEKILALIKAADRDSKNDSTDQLNSYFSYISQRLQSTHSTTEKVLTGQTDMEAKLGGLLHDLKQASASIVTKTENLEKTSNTLFVEIQKAVKNTSTKVALAVGLGTGLVAGVPSGIAGNTLFERFHPFFMSLVTRSEPEKSTKAEPQEKAAAPSAPPPPLNLGLPKWNDPNFYNFDSGKFSFNGSLLPLRSAVPETMCRRPPEFGLETKPLTLER